MGARDQAGECREGEKAVQPGAKHQRRQVGGSPTQRDPGTRWGVASTGASARPGCNAARSARRSLGSTHKSKLALHLLEQRLYRLRPSHHFQHVRRQHAANLRNVLLQGRKGTRQRRRRSEDEGPRAACGGPAGPRPPATLGQIACTAAAQLHSTQHHRLCSVPPRAPRPARHRCQGAFPTSQHPEPGG